MREGDTPKFRGHPKIGVGGFKIGGGDPEIGVRTLKGISKWVPRDEMGRRQFKMGSGTPKWGWGTLKLRGHTPTRNEPQNGAGGPQN